MSDGLKVLLGALGGALVALLLVGGFSGGGMGYGMMGGMGRMMSGSMMGGYKQVKNSLGWAHYQVRKDLSIRRHLQLVCCAFSFCWWACREECREVGSPPVVVLKDPEHPSTAAEGALVAGALLNAHAILEGVLRDAPATAAKSAA